MSLADELLNIMYIKKCFLRACIFLWVVFIKQLMLSMYSPVAVAYLISGAQYARLRYYIYSYNFGNPNNTQKNLKRSHMFCALLCYNWGSVHVDVAHMLDNTTGTKTVIRSYETMFLVPVKQAWKIRRKSVLLCYVVVRYKAIRLYNSQPLHWHWGNCLSSPEVNE